MKNVLIIAILSVVAAACGGSSGTSDTTTQAEKVAAYAEAIPNMDMLALSEDDAAAADAGTAASAKLVGDPSAIQDHTKQVMLRVNTLLRSVSDKIAAIVGETSNRNMTKDGLPCMVWEGDREKNHWKLEVCELDAEAKRYGFIVQGRPLDSTSEEDYLTVSGGTNAVLPSYDGKRRGHGQIGFNFDNWASLTGSTVGGTLGMGYRAAGTSRQVIVGLNAVRGADDSAARSGVYRFHRVIGLGGRFSFVTANDFIKPAAGDALASGQDGVEEMGRIIVGWAAGGAARLFWVACGGTVGEGSCVYGSQCTDGDGLVTWNDVKVDAMAITWDPVECPEVPIAVEEPPAESDFDPPSTSDELDAPIMEEPPVSDLE